MMMCKGLAHGKCELLCLSLHCMWPSGHCFAHETTMLHREESAMTPRLTPRSPLVSSNLKVIK